jgi:predicted dehydrogenase
VNLGIVQPDIDVLLDLAPHDLSLLELFFPDVPVTEVVASVSDPLGVGRSCIGHLDVRLGSGVTGHIHVNWLSPTKIRRFVVAGSEAVVVWDDLSHAQRVSVFDAGVQVGSEPDLQQRESQQVSYRTGSVSSPLLPEREAIAVMIDHLASAVRGGARFPTDGSAGQRVLRVLDAADRSVASRSWELVS